MSGKKINVTQTKSLIGTKKNHRATIRGLGLKRINHTVEVHDTPSIRGMIEAVAYLVRVESK